MTLLPPCGGQFLTSGWDRDGWQVSEKYKRATTKNFRPNNHHFTLDQNHEYKSHPRNHWVRNRPPSPQHIQDFHNRKPLKIFAWCVRIVRLVVWLDHIPQSSHHRFGGCNNSRIGSVTVDKVRTTQQSKPLRSYRYAIQTVEIQGSCSYRRSSTTLSRLTTLYINTLPLPTRNGIDPETPNTPVITMHPSFTCNPFELYWNSLSAVIFFLSCFLRKSWCNFLWLYAYVYSTNSAHRELLWEFFTAFGAFIEIFNLYSRSLLPFPNTS